MNSEQIEYGGWKDCRRLSNGTIEAVVTAEVGPRVIRFGFCGGRNLFKEFEDTLGVTGGDDWRLYGGHRLWHAPEHPRRTYCPDNYPVAVTAAGGRLEVRQAPEPATGIEKEMTLEITGERSLRITHRLRNTNLWGIRLAPWALSVMAPGGTAVIPHPPRGEHPRDLPPVNHLTLWSYSDMSDPRWTWGRRYLLLRQDPAASTPQKVGASVPDGWAAYVLDGQMFVKRFDYDPGARYADKGCNVEVFTNGDMLEVESLGPFAALPPDGVATHVEHWYLADGLPAPGNDADVETHLLPCLESLS